MLYETAQDYAVIHPIMLHTKVCVSRADVSKESVLIQNDSVPVTKESILIQNDSVLITKESVLAAKESELVAKKLVPVTKK